MKINTSFLKRNPTEFPKSLTIEPTNKCNLNCPLCSTRMDSIIRDKKDMTLEQFKSIIDQCKSKIESVSLYLFGEPFLHKNILDMVRYSSEAGINVFISTNGTIINGIDHAEKVINSGISRLTISLDGIQNDTYKIYRIGGDYDKVINNIKLLIQAKKNTNNIKTKIVIQTIIMKHNEHQRDSLRKTSKDLGADAYYEKGVIISTNIETEPEKFKEMADKYLPNDRNMRLYTLKDEHYVMSGNIHNNCGFLFNKGMMTICSNGNVIPCCHDINSDYIMGNVFEKTLSQIWNDKKFKKFRKSIKQNQANLALCRTCHNARDRTFKSCYYEF